VLASTQGQQLLTQRIKQAAKEVCTISRAITPDDIMQRNLCEKRAIARAMPKAEQKIAAYINSRQLALRDARPVAGN
jgi:UrcA family protein